MNPSRYYFNSRNYSARHTVFALFCLLLGYLFSRFSPVSTYPAAAFGQILILLIAALVVIKPKKQPLTCHCWCCSVMVFLLACGVILSGSAWVASIAFHLALATVCYMVSAEYGNRIEKGFSNFIYLDYIRALLLPFRALLAIFEALFNKRSGKGAHYFGKAVLGIGLAILPTVIIFAILSYDSGFLSIMESIFSFDEESFFNFILDLHTGVFFGMYLFGLFIAAGGRYIKDTMTAQSCSNGLARVKILPQITALSASLPILFMYVVFFISQWKYYVSGFTGILPENLSYAEYAREGFFQLCTVSAINLFIIVLFALFIRQGNSGKAPVLKLLSSTFCLFTLVLIATAVSKLVMYINFYGMTLKRLCAMWAMVVIGLVFLIIALGQFLRRFKTVTICLCITGILFGVLCLSNPNALVARYNADRYLSGTLQQLDVDAMEDLGVSAVPAMAYILENADPDPHKPLPKDLSQILSYLLNISDEYSKGESSFLNYNIPDYLAMHALQELGLLK